jgi:hypothetical protein
MARAKTPRNNAGNTNGQSVAPSVSPVPPETVSEIREVRKTAPDARTNDARNNIVPINLEDEIRRRAYELWEQHGREPGRENEHWLLAEREILTRYHAQRQQSA